MSDKMEKEPDVSAKALEEKLKAEDAAKEKKEEKTGDDANESAAVVIASVSGAAAVVSGDNQEPRALISPVDYLAHSEEQGWRTPANIRELRRIRHAKMEAAFGSVSETSAVVEVLDSDEECETRAMFTDEEEAKMAEINSICDNCGSEEEYDMFCSQCYEDML